MGLEYASMNQAMELMIYGLSIHGPLTLLYPFPLPKILSTLLFLSQTTSPLTLFLKYKIRCMGINSSSVGSFLQSSRGSSFEPRNRSSYPIIKVVRSILGSQTNRFRTSVVNCKLWVTEKEEYCEGVLHKGAGSRHIPDAGRSFPDTTFPELDEIPSGVLKGVDLAMPGCRVIPQSRVSRMISPNASRRIIDTSRRLKVGSAEPRSVNSLTKSLHRASTRGFFLFIGVFLSEASSPSPIK